jgi:hypothetical protein
MNKILVGIHGRPSIKNVYSLMKNTAVELWVRRRVKGKEYWRVYTNGISDKYRVEYSPSFAGDTILRWGNEIVINHPDCKIYNQARGIQNASAKGRARTQLNDAGIKVPTIVTNENCASVHYPVIARPQTHAKGKNIVILKTVAEYRDFQRAHSDWYFAEFYPKDREVRVHVWFGKVLAMMEKPAPKDKTTVAWNRAVVNEEWNAINWSDYHYNACLEALKAVETLGLDSGGVDVMIRGEEAVVLEVNTAPTLISSPYVSGRYAEAFNWLFTGGEKNHWDFTQFKKAESFAWKHNQLKNV